MTTMQPAATRSMKGVANPLMTGRAGPGAAGDAQTAWRGYTARASGAMTASPPRTTAGVSRAAEGPKIPVPDRTY